MSSTRRGVTFKTSRERRRRREESLTELQEEIRRRQRTIDRLEAEERDLKARAPAPAQPAANQVDVPLVGPVDDRDLVLGLIALGGIWVLFFREP